MLFQRTFRRRTSVALVLVMLFGIAGCRFDTTPPQLVVPIPGFVVGGQIGPSGPWEYVGPDATMFTYDIPVDLRWSATDNNDRCQLLYDVYTDEGRAPRPRLVASPATSYAAIDGDFDNNFWGGGLQLWAWIVRATDCDGNSTEQTVRAHTAVIQQNGSSYYGLTSAPYITYSPSGGDWQEIGGDPELSGGSTMRTLTPGAAVSYVRNYEEGMHLGLVMTLGPEYGTAIVRVDGNHVKTINTNAPERRTRRIALSHRMSAGEHTVSVTNQASAGHPQIEIDAFLVGPGAYAPSS